MTTIENPWLAGNFGPVTEEVTAVDLPVTGTIPAALEGRYLRNGPNPLGPVDPATYHWFTGTGMVHGIRLRDGRAEWYRNRFVRSPDVAEALGEPVPPSPYAEDVRIFGANTNVIGHAGTTLAIVEAGAPPIELTYELDTSTPSAPPTSAAPSSTRSAPTPSATPQPASCSSSPTGGRGATSSGTSWCRPTAR
jgi:carotenoid cleavage dioxygenase